MTMTTERRRDKRDGVCYVQGCKSGYKSCKETRSLFRAPIEPERLAEWSRKIPRRDRPFDHACVVCERHFDERFIERTFRTKIKGEIVEIPRDRPLLTKDAVPTIFPEAPKYYTKKLPKKRKERNLCDQVRAKPPKRQEHSTVENACVPTSKEASEGLNCEPGSPQNEHVETTDDRLVFSRLRIPKGWSEITLVDYEGLRLYAQCEADVAEPYCSVVMLKSVRIEARQGGLDTAAAEVRLRGKIWCEQELTTREEAEELIDSIDKLLLCPGVGMQPLTRECPAYNGKFFSKDCTLFADEKLGRSCASCRYQRKLIQNQMGRRRKRGYEVIMTRASDMRWVVEVSPAGTTHKQVTEGVAVDSVEVFEEAGTE
ncbi:hypothetical protein HPB52_021777 [Rhipicephalus sanguineus]|uniref:THAP-type domain-containing protein n=1 Tax=Rhipicephalus sanguineus TaxID=34632 RepID=A0A9D4PG88_RHISA|nr:hypothetical protein HPB52_021777 [Rhipicephalus sanguineus]